MMQMMGEEKGRKYMEALSKQNIQARIGSSLMNQLMMAGEFPLVISQYPTGVEELKKAGAPIDWVPLDPWFVYPIGICGDCEELSSCGGAVLRDLHSPGRRQNIQEKLGPNTGKEVYPADPAAADAGAQIVCHQAGIERDLQQI